MKPGPMRWLQLTVLPLVIGLVSVFSIPLIYLAYGVTSVEHRKLFTWLMQWGGAIGFVIHGSNVTIPAHYHGCIVGVTLALMGLVYLLLPRLGYREPDRRWATWQPYLYGFGQLLHVTGLLWSDGYGVQRKVGGGEQVLRSAGEIAGMGVDGARWTDCGRRRALVRGTGAARHVGRARPFRGNRG